MEMREIQVGRISDLKEMPMLESAAISERLKAIGKDAEARGDNRGEDAEQLHRLEMLLTRILDELVEIKGILAASAPLESADESHEAM